MAPQTLYFWMFILLIIIVIIVFWIMAKSNGDSCSSDTDGSTVHSNNHQSTNDHTESEIIH